MPKNIKCPNCGNLTFSFWQKQFLGPARSIPCDDCGARVSVSWIRFIPVLLLIATLSLLYQFGLTEHGVGPYLAVVAATLVAVVVYQHYLVTLVVRSRPDR